MRRRFHRREVRELVEYAEARGWSCDFTKNGHIVMRHPKVPQKLYTSSTPSDPRSCLNHKALIRRKEREAGLFLD